MLVYKKFCDIYIIMILAMLINLQQSWSDKFLERIQNVIKRSQKMSIETKEEVIEDEPKGPSAEEKTKNWLVIQ